MGPNEPGRISYSDDVAAVRTPSRKLIAVQAGEAQRCGFASVFEIIQPDPTTSYEQSKAFDHINDLIRSNNCVACSIPYRLSGEQPTIEQACAAQ